MVDPIFLVAGQHPDLVHLALGEVIAAEGRDDVGLEVRPDRRGAVVVLTGAGAGTVAERASERLTVVTAPPPVGVPLDRARPVAEVSPPAPSTPSPGAWDRPTDPTVAIPLQREPGLRLSDGALVPLRGRVVIGRDPVGGPGDETRTVADPERTVSKTHLAVELRPDGVWVEDQGSTNGTYLLGADGSSQRLEAGRPARLLAGGGIRFGGLTAKLEV